MSQVFDRRQLNYEGPGDVDWMSAIFLNSEDVYPTLFSIMFAGRWKLWKNRGESPQKKRGRSFEDAANAC
jgi:hypothetical protein